MATISKTDIVTNNTIQAEHITRIIDALNGTGSADVIATGSFTGSFIGAGSGITGIVSASYATTASYAINVGTDTNLANTDLTVDATRTHELNGNELTIQDTSTGTVLFLDPNTPEASLYLGQHAVTVQDNGVVLNAAVGLTSNAVLLTTASIEFNTQNADADFIVDSSTVANALYVDGLRGTVGINTSTPSGTLSIRGSFSTQEITKTYAGDYDDLDFGNFSFLSIRATSDVKINGILSEGKNGTRLVIYAGDMASGAYSASLMHEAASSTAANRLLNGNAGTDLVLQEGDTAQYIYSDLKSRWIYIGGSV